MLPPKVPGVLLLFSPHARTLSQPVINMHVAAASAITHAQKSPFLFFRFAAVPLF